MVVEAEKSAEALPPLNVGVRVDRRWRSLQELVGAALMVSHVMGMFDELADELAYMSLAKRDHATETLLFDRADEPLGIGVEMGTLRWQPNRLDTDPSGSRRRRRVPAADSAVALAGWQRFAVLRCAAARSALTHPAFDASR